MHRVSVAIDSLQAALQIRLPGEGAPLGPLDELALVHPAHLERVAQLQQELLDLTIAVASLKELVELDTIVAIDPTDIRVRLDVLTQQFREHQASEAALISEVVGVAIDET